MVAVQSVQRLFFLEPLQHHLDSLLPMTRFLSLGHQSYGLVILLSFTHSHSRAHEKCISSNDPRIPICKHWKTKGICIFQQKCQFRHPPDFASSSSNPFQSITPTTLESTHRTRTGTWNRRRIYNDGRASVLRRWLLKVFPMNYLRSGSGVLDVAGGKGEVSFEIVNLNQIQSTVYDPRPLDLFRFKKKLQFGFYHRNEILECYNPLPPPSFPVPSPFISTSTEEEVSRGVDKLPTLTLKTERPTQLPLHIRGYFQMFDSMKTGSSFEKSRQQERNEEREESEVEPTHHCQLFPLALQTEEEFSNQLKMARQVRWTKKGLQHEEEEEGDGEEEEEQDDQSVSQSITTCDADSSRQSNVRLRDMEGGIEIQNYLEACDIVKNCSIVVGMHPDQVTLHLSLPAPLSVLISWSLNRLSSTSSTLLSQITNPLLWFPVVFTTNNSHTGPPPSYLRPPSTFYQIALDRDRWLCASLW
jgi:hypothetical protein